MSFDSKVQGLATAVVRAAIDAGVSVGTAESCTGGLVCAALTEIPGSSEAVRGSIVSYATEVKEHVLHVSRDITQREGVGVVSRECACAMAEGARRALDCDVAVSVTGIAGPGGAEVGKPVGTVWIGIASTNGSRAILHHFEGDRSEVRAQTTEKALELALEEINLKY